MFGAYERRRLYRLQDIPGLGDVGNVDQFDD
jgi:hypothetical protein